MRLAEHVRCSSPKPALPSGGGSGLALGTHAAMGGRASQQLPDKKAHCKTVMPHVCVAGAGHSLRVRCAAHEKFLGLMGPARLGVQVLSCIGLWDRCAALGARLRARRGGAVLRIILFAHHSAPIIAVRLTTDIILRTKRTYNTNGRGIRRRL